MLKIKNKVKSIKSSQRKMVYRTPEKTTAKCQLTPIRNNRGQKTK